MGVRSKNMNSEVDINVLVGIYNQRIATLTNQNILLEAKLQSLMKDFKDLEIEKNFSSENFESSSGIEKKSKINQNKQELEDE